MALAPQPSPEPRPRPAHGPGGGQPAFGQVGPAHGPGGGQPAFGQPGPAHGPGGVQPVIRERPAEDPAAVLAALVKRVDWGALAVRHASPEQLLRELEVIDDRLVRVGDLADRVVRLPLVADPEKLAARLAELGRRDVRECLREITRTCEGLGASPVTGEDDPDGWIARLEATITVLDRRGAPQISVVPGPDGEVEGRRPRRPVTDLTVRDSRAIMYGTGNTLHIVHDCAVEQPVIEVASLLDYDAAGDTEAWFHSVEPVRSAATEDLRTTITRSSGISIGTGNHQQSVFVHRIGSCPVNLGRLIAVPQVRQAIVACRETAGDPAEAMAALHQAVEQAAGAADVSALVPDCMVARLAAAGEDAPRMSGRGPRLTIRHGAGVAVGWDTTVTGETRVRIGKPQVR
ncbi:hypothetical protein [Actinoplanes subtropicus]|uniref:hypothetical protein n=1 Tax=Actinoplanes subtropicus TaxID=543632 RepID=UPI0004C40AEE|nr:hypothetical protein [Actinoplanes subtropicus]